ncbi:MAG: GNAT family N-acetyltransferase [Actinobacteria bacterium]|nr:GNAT family N-acetyltransferase [Actinomycetota bacterium]
MAIRPARPDDLESLLTIQRAASTTAFAHIFPPERYPFPDDAVREEWREALGADEIEIHVADADGEPVGVVTVDRDLLGQLYVLPGRQGSGVGSTLHDLALERLRARGHSRARLWCLTENWDARRFYERRGWTLTDVTRAVPFPPNPIDVQYAREL